MMTFSRPLLVALAAGAFAAAASAEPVTYALEPTHTFVTFEIGHMGTSTNRGRFDKKEGTVQLDRAAKTGKLDVTVSTNSLNTGTEKFSNHIMSDEMLNVAQFPTAHFVGDKFVFNGDKVAEIDGQLTMMGKTNPVALKAINFNCFMNPMLKRETCGGDFEATIQRSQWGITYGMNYGFPDAVHLVIQAEAIKQ